jgi:hypothetical protein
MRSHPPAHKEHHNVQQQSQATATTDEGRIELTERDLSQAGGGIIRRVGDTIKYSPWKIDVAQF